MCIMFLPGSMHHHSLFRPGSSGAGFSDKGRACLSSSTELYRLASDGNEKFIETPLQYKCLLKTQNRQLLDVTLHFAEAHLLK